MTILTSSQVSLGDLLCEAKSYFIGFFLLGLVGALLAWPVVALISRDAPSWAHPTASQPLSDQSKESPR